jgi:hypothetical protein
MLSYSRLENSIIAELVPPVPSKAIRDVILAGLCVLGTAVWRMIAHNIAFCYRAMQG